MLHECKAQYFANENKKMISNDEKLSVFFSEKSRRVWRNLMQKEQQSSYLYLPIIHFNISIARFNI